MRLVLPYGGAMPEPLAPERTYSPEIVVSMSMAFDSVCRALPTAVNSDAAMRRLALIIQRQVDGGERDAERLSELALREFTGSVRFSIGCARGRDAAVVLRSRGRAPQRARSPCR